MGGEIKQSAPHDSARSRARGARHRRHLYRRHGQRAWRRSCRTRVNPSSGVMQAIGASSTRFGWNALTPIAALLVALSCIGSAGAWLGCRRAHSVRRGHRRLSSGRVRPHAPALGLSRRRTGDASRHRGDLHLSRSKRHERPRCLRRPGQLDGRHHARPLPASCLRPRSNWGARGRRRWFGFRAESGRSRSRRSSVSRRRSARSSSPAFRPTTIPTKRSRS